MPYQWTGNEPIVKAIGSGVMSIIIRPSVRAAAATRAAAYTAPA
jgi:hypothetical protein